jgi:hypothetical protein
VDAYTLIQANVNRALHCAGIFAEFYVKIAQTPKEEKELLEVGFDYLCEKNCLALFTKRS